MAGAWREISGEKKEQGERSHSCLKKKSTDLLMELLVYASRNRTVLARSCCKR